MIVSIYRTWWACIALLTCILSLTAQENRERQQKIYRDRVDANWFAGNDKFWYRVSLPEDRYEFVLIHAAVGQRSTAFDHERLAKALSELTKADIEPNKLPFESIKFSDDEKILTLIGKDKSWSCKLDTYEVSELPTEAKPTEEPRPRDERRPRGNRGANSVRSPDGKWEAFVIGDNLYLRHVESKKEQPLTYDGNPTSSYARNADRERLMEMQYDARDPQTPTPQVVWSPDSRKLVAFRFHAGTERTVHLIESSPKDQLQPKQDSYPYLKPGDEIPLRIPHLFDVENTKEITISNELFANPWSIEDVRWHTDSSHFTFYFNQRGHQVLRVLKVDATSGQVSPIINEQSQTFISYSGKFFCDYLDDTQEIIWMSERDGWNHLYLYDAKTGTVKSQITRGEWVVRGVDHVDKEKRQVWFRLGGYHTAQDPYYIHYARINFDGTGLTLLTEGDATHALQFSPDRRFYIDTYSRVDLPPVIELRRSDDGKLVFQLETADATALLASGWQPPERFFAKGRDGITDIYGIIHRPRTIDPQKKYPIIESIYAGPHDSFVPKGFRINYGQSKLTDRGFVVVQIDGMGTSNRSKKFHDVCWKNIGDAGFPDRILWMKAAAEKYPYLDTSRVGIYGGSAGGQNALGALLNFGDFYKAAAADCGCHDNRMDKIWWNEQWMGWPVGVHYDEQSNVTQAHKLQGKLLLTVGELDRNVDPASTMQVASELIKADKEFELIVFPGGGHGAGGSPYGEKRRTEFFVRHLKPDAAE